MKWFGLTGGIATGKSTVTKVLRTMGYPVIDADEVSHLVTALGSPSLPQIFAEFGYTVRAPDGGLDRRALGQLVFGRPEELQKLEQIVHPLVTASVAAEKLRLEKSGAAVAFYDVPLLFEKNLEANFDAVVLVAASEVQQQQRLLSRSGLNLSEVTARLQSQLPIAAKRQRTKYVIDNSKDLAHLENEIRRVLNELGVARIAGS